MSEDRPPNREEIVPPFEYRPPNRDEIVARFHHLFYCSMAVPPPEDRTKMHWLGVRALKNPLDAWIYQEIVYEMRPDVIVETGTGFGGSAYFLACICDMLGSGRIITIDLRPKPVLPQHPRITYISGSSVEPEVVSSARSLIGADEKVMVILDSKHRGWHVLGELRAYASFVSENQYLIVEDSNLGGNPVAPDFGPGPMEAIQAFLDEDDTFVVDRTREKFMVTFNPSGYLKRVRPRTAS
jgi:cephalosporin hydroxylase